MVRVHGEEKEKEYKCEKCGKIFYGENLLQKHLRSDNCDTQKNFSCDQCTPSKWFKKRDSMLTHIKIYHTGEIAKVKCNQREKLFGSKQSLDQHEIIHEPCCSEEGQRTDPNFIKKKLTTGPIPRKRKGQPISKSAPVKLIKSSSPKHSRGGKGRGGKVASGGKSK